MQKKSLFDIACVAAPKLGGGLCMVLLNLTLMRYMGRELFGVYSLCVVIILLLSEAFFGAAIDMGVLRFALLCRKEDPARSFRFECTAFQLKLGIVGSVSVVLILASGPLSRWLFHRDDMSYLVWIVCAAALGMLGLGTALVHLQIREKFALYGVLDFLGMLMKFGGIGATLALLGSSDRPLNPGWILLWFAVGPALVFLTFMGTIARGFLRFALWDHSTAWELLKYVKWLLLTSALVSLVAKLDLLLLTALSTPEEAGILAGGQTITSIPPLLGSYLAVVYSPKILPWLRDGRFFPLLCKVQSVLIAGSFLAYVLVTLNIDFIKTRILPESFHASSSVILILLPASLASMTSFPLVVSFLMFVRPRFLIVLECLLLPLLILAYLVMIPKYGAIGAAITTASFLIVKTVIALAATLRLARHPLEESGVRVELDDTRQQQPA